MAATTALLELADTLRRLPPTVIGEFRDGDRVLRLNRPKNGLALELKLLRMHDDPLVHAVIELPAGGAQAPSCKSKRDNATNAFHQREQRYLDAMIAWAQRVLSAEPAPTLFVRKANPPWKKHVRALIAAATLGAVAPARRFLEEFSEELEDADDSERASEALYFLREEGVAIHLDWKDDGELIPLSRETAKRKGMEPIRAALQQCVLGGSIEEEISRVASAIKPAGFALVGVNEGSDSYLLLIAPMEQANTAIKALAALGMDTRVCE
jgi:hypothetical protein